MSTLLEHLLEGHELVPEHDHRPSVIGKRSENEKRSASEERPVKETPPIDKKRSVNETPSVGDTTPVGETPWRANDKRSVKETRPVNKNRSVKETPYVNETPLDGEIPSGSETMEPRPCKSSEKLPDTAASAAAVRSGSDVSSAATVPGETKTTNPDPPLRNGAGHRENQPNPVDPLSTAPPTPVNRLTSESTPVIFVGFGTGANSLLHLAVNSRLSAAPPARNAGDRCGGGGVCLDGQSGCGGGGMIGRGHVRGSRTGSVGGGGCGGGGGGGDSGSSSLAAALHRSGLRVGGFVLVNGFVTLEKQASQVSGPRGQGRGGGGHFHPTKHQRFRWRSISRHEKAQQYSAK